MSQIDTIDERILAELQANGRLTMKALAERVGLSSPAMIERVRRLEDRGVIAGYRAIVSPAALGRPLTALVSVSVDRGSQEAFLEALRSEASVAECHRTTGESTYLVKVHVADPASLEALIDRLTPAGAKSTSALVLSSPLDWQEVTPPEGSTQARTRLPRRRRRAGAAEEAVAEAPATPRRPGRPRGRRATS
jgi:Lrp/AsnC family leucine-responsive transcriptional regulator